MKITIVAIMAVFLKVVGSILLYLKKVKFLFPQCARNSSQFDIKELRVILRLPNHS